MQLQTKSTPFSTLVLGFTKILGKFKILTLPLLDIAASLGF